MDVVVTGAGGTLGRAVLAAWRDDHVVGLDRHQLDVADEGAVLAALTELAPEVVVNCAAMTHVDGCESRPEQAHAVNALGPWWLARACDVVGATLVHVSTDYVFGGPAPTHPDGTPRAWTEFDATGPRSVYGRSKAAGEQLVRQSCARHHVVRTAWLQGREGPCFVRTMLELAAAGTPLRVVDDCHGNPTSADDLAVALREVAVSGRHGTWHRTNAGHATWFELAAAVFVAAGVEADLAPQSIADLRQPAPRPTWSVLDDGHATASGLQPLRPWRAAIADLAVAIAGEVVAP